MSRQITLHGVPARVQSFFRRGVLVEGGLTLRGTELAVIIRGRLPEPELHPADDAGAAPGRNGVRD